MTANSDAELAGSGSPSLSADDRYVVVSADGHVGPMVREHLRPYCESKYLDEFDRYTDEMEQNVQYSVVPALNSPDFRQRFEELRFEERVQAAARHSKYPGLWDQSVRIKDMDEEGVAAEVIFHGGLNGQSIPFSGSGLIAWSDAKYDNLEPVGVRIYNRWLADFVSGAPDRHIGLAYIPITDPQACVKEVEWAAENGLRGINLPAIRRDFPAFNERIWDPLWAACQANDMSLNTHAGGGDHYPYSGLEAFSLFTMESYFLARRALWVMIFGGVFERFPGLKIVFTEQTADWVKSTIEEMDSCYFGSLFGDKLREALLPKPPSEYFMSNCWIGASFMSEAEAKSAVEDDLVEKYLWGSDYPHSEGTWPRTQKSQRKTYSDVAPAHVAKMLGESAIDVFGLNRDVLRAIADRIGPSVAELQEPYQLPPGEFAGLAFRDRGRHA